MSPFARTDLIVCVTDLDDSHMDFRNHRGAGRLLHLDAGFSPKGVLWTEAHGLVVGAAFSPGMDLLVTADPVARAVVAFDGAGRRIGRIDGLPDRPFGSVAFDAEGRPPIRSDPRGSSDSGSIRRPRRRGSSKASCSTPMAVGPAGTR
jgi:hypothetical protein